MTISSRRLSLSDTAFSGSRAQFAGGLFGLLASVLICVTYSSNIAAGSEGDFRIVTDDAVTATGDGKVEFRIGIRGVRDDEKGRIGAIGITIKGLSHYFPNDKDVDCRVESQVADWFVTGGNITDDGLVRVIGLGTKNPLKHDMQHVFTVICPSNGKIVKDEVKIKAELSNEQGDALQADPVYVEVWGNKVAKGTASLSGKVLDGNNQPVDDAKVYCGEYTTVSAKDGSFRCSDIAQSKTYKVGAKKFAYRFFEQDVTVKGVSVMGIVLRGEYVGSQLKTPTTANQTSATPGTEETFPKPGQAGDNGNISPDGMSNGDGFRYETAKAGTKTAYAKSITNNIVSAADRWKIFWWLLGISGFGIIVAGIVLLVGKLKQPDLNQPV